MTPSVPLALGMGLLILSIVLSIGLIPVLDAELRRATARRAAADAALATSREAERSPG